MIKAVILLCMISLSFPTPANTIYIHTDNLTDFKALKESNGENNLSVSTNLLALHLNSTNIEFDYMTTKRSLTFMDEGQNICVVNKIRTKDREEKYRFSQPINLFLGRRLYQHANKQPLSFIDPTTGVIALSDLFKNKENAKIIISAQISYGDALDQQLSRIDKKNKLTRHSGGHDSGIISMFAKARAEFALLYPQQVHVSEHKLNTRSYEVANSPPFFLGRLMCTDTPVTEAFITQVNQRLSSKSIKEQLLNVHLKFIDSNDKSALKKYFHQAF
jgi:uncharacterized protein (TIGR02285 family)